MRYTAKCLFFGLWDSMLRILFIVRSLGFFVIYLRTRAAFYVVSYSEKSTNIIFVLELLVDDSIILNESWDFDTAKCFGFFFV